MENKNVYKTDEATNELENGSVIIKERDVTISLARFEELIRAEQKLVLLCRSIYESDDYEAKRYRIIAGEKLEEEKARKQKEGK